MEIRKAESCDVERINQLLYQVAEIHAKGRADIFKSESKKYTDEQLIEIINCEQTPVFVAVEDNYVVGYAFCVYQRTENNQLLQDKKTLYIDDICVDESVRGKHIGTGLYEYVIAYAKEKGLDNITLNVWAFNESAYQFYKKCGMTPQRIIMEKEV